MPTNVRFATETEEERAARLQQMSANQRHRLASETGEEEQPDHLILPFSCPPHPSCSPNTMLHTYFLLGMIVHVYAHTVVGLTRAQNHAKQGEWEGRVHPPRGPSWGSD